MSVMAAPHSRSRQREAATSPVRYTLATSSLGHVAIARSAKGLAAAFIDDDAERLEQHMAERFPGAIAADPDEFTDRVIAALEDSRGDVDLPLDPEGTAFQKTVWRALRDIPAGATITYSELANRIGRPGSTRAVAAACGANPIAVIVPCHRVVGKDGSLTGYAWGIERKRMLLEREKAAAG
ncbi:MAG TPA: methylated-DNA--[protein]-cysteine S-methyltransferase [Gemmatimonadaceae bacterium]|nr:methylated-DNA--[protein]-cysteine S-methyltransferase [Gemmatimonadaceae bacterium]